MSTKLQEFTQAISKIKTWKDPFYFTQGWTRYLFRRLLPTHIREQIEWRMFRMNPQCHAGACVHCGCKTPQLQYATKGCGAGCYPPLQTKAKWPWFREFMAFKSVANNPALQRQNWVEDVKDIGTQKIGKEVQFYFEYTGSFKIKKVDSGCQSCTKSHFADGKLHVKFKAQSGQVPRVDNKIIKVYYDTKFGEIFDVLRFKAQIDG